MWIPVGLITVVTPGTPVSLVASFTYPEIWPGPSDRTLRVHGVMFDTLKTNTGDMYVGVTGLNKATYANVLKVLPYIQYLAGPNGIPYTFSVSLTQAAAAIALSDLWLDADVGNSKALVSILVL